MSGFRQDPGNRISGDLDDEGGWWEVYCWIILIIIRLVIKHGSDLSQDIISGDCDQDVARVILSHARSTIVPWSLLWSDVTSTKYIVNPRHSSLGGGEENCL